MDDYLAKPVRSTLLEKMLVKWLVNEPEKAMRMNGQTPPSENLRARLVLTQRDIPQEKQQRQQRPLDLVNNEDRVSVRD